MEELFFQVQPLWWIGSIKISSYGVALGVSIACFLVYQGWKRKKEMGEQSKILQPILSSSPRPILQKYTNEVDDYPEKVMYALKSIIAYKNLGHQPFHETAGEIRKYITDKQLCDILTLLEIIEYRNKTMTEEEYKEIHPFYETSISPYIR